MPAANAIFNIPVCVSGCALDVWEPGGLRYLPKKRWHDEKLTLPLLYIRKWKIKAQKIVSRLSPKSKKIMAQEMKTAVLSIWKEHFPGECSICSIIVFYGIANAKAFDVGISNNKTWGNSSQCYGTHACQPMLNQCPKDAPQNLRP